MTSRTRRVGVIAAVATLALITAACGNDNNKGTATKTTGDGLTFTIKNFAFPAISAPAGATLTLLDADSEAHTVTATDNTTFDSGVFSKGKPGKLTLPDQPGTYPIYCKVHPTTMKGTLTITPKGGAAAAPTGSIEVDDQKTDGTFLTVKSVTIGGAANGGWIALHIDLNGSPGPVMGHIHVAPGTSNNVRAAFDNKQSSGKFWPMLHVDAGQPNVYEFGQTSGPNPDVPVKSGNDIVMKEITLTVS